MIAETDEKYERYIKPFLAEDGEDSDFNEGFKCALEIKKIIVNDKVQAKGQLFFVRVTKKIFVVTSARLFVLKESKKGLLKKTDTISFDSEMLRSQLSNVSLEYSERKPKLYIGNKNEDKWVLRTLTKEDASETYKILKSIQAEIAKKDSDKKSEIKKLQDNAFMKLSGVVESLSEDQTVKKEAAVKVKADEK